MPKPAECEGCPLFEAEGPVWGAGPSQGARLVLVGEAPGVDELRFGVPFIGAAGRVLDIALVEAGVCQGGWRGGEWRADRSLLYVTNVVKCMPPGAKGASFRKPTPQEVKFCSARWLRAELKAHPEATVVALGDVAAKALGMPRDGKITEWRGCVMEGVEP